MPFLVDDERQTAFALDAEVTTIGRASDCNIHLDDPMVSRHHAEIRRGPDGIYRVIDLGTRHGTIHGERRVSEAPLAHGDELLIGGVRLRFQDVKSAGEARIASAPAKAEHTALYPPSAEVTDLARLKLDYDKLRAAFTLSQGLSAARDAESMLPAVLNTAFSVLKADRGIIVLLDAHTLQPSLQHSRQRNHRPTDISISTNLLSEIIDKREGVLTFDNGSDERFNRASSLLSQSVRSAMCVPMSHQGELVGVIQLDSQAAVGSFDSNDLELFTVIASQAAAAIHGARLTAQVQSMVSEERARLGRLISDLPDGVLMLDSQLHLLLQNRRAEELLAPLGGVPIGTRIENIGPLKIGEMVAARGSVDLQVNGEPARMLALQATQSHSLLGPEVVVLIRDVTKERERETRMAQDDRLATLGTLAGGIAHDFANILAVISNFAAFVHDAVQGQPVSADVEQIQIAARRASDLTRQLLAFGRREQVRPRVITIEAVLGTMEPMLRRLLGTVNLEIRLAPSPWRVKVDPIQLEQVVLNLSVNARDAMPNGGTIFLETTQVELSEVGARAESLPPGRYVTLIARDTGKGMSPEIAARVFEPFFTTKERGKGTGLGLATVYGIATQAGGAVRLASELGKGTTFRVLLPATSELPEIEELVMEKTPAATNATVLLIEDDAVVREITRRILESAGYRVRSAADAETALKLLAAEPSDLLVTDLVMPGMGGKQLVREVTKQNPKQRVLYMSAYFEDAYSASSDGVPFLSKPFTRQELLNEVLRTLTKQP